MSQTPTNPSAPSNLAPVPPPALELSPASPISVCTLLEPDTLDAALKAAHYSQTELVQSLVDRCRDPDPEVSLKAQSLLIQLSKTAAQLSQSRARIRTVLTERKDRHGNTIRTHSVTASALIQAHHNPIARLASDLATPPADDQSPSGPSFS